ncbi:SAVED domain-containing protein [Streptomyces sp. NPDC093261]|uniref:SAVED domain-containing protein n=1 Tax=Streptomyces sp. NPDC093261 TaxID=3366037 RepID=UPI003812F7F1
MARKSIPDVERLKVWVRAGGRCELCGTYLLEGKLTYQDFTLGELAHIVGQDATPKSPRGMDPLPKDQRDLADNLMLLCRGEHNEIDRKGSLDVMTVERLRRIKRDREEWIRRLTALNPETGTVVIRLIGQVRGQEVELTKPTAAEAVIRSEERFPDFPLSLHGDGFEIDLRRIPGEKAGGPAYWEQCQQQIDRVLEHKLAEALREDSVHHVSAFAFARLPLLAYFGSRLDDTFTVSIYQRHRSTESWSWPDTTDRMVRFVTEPPLSPAPDASDGVLILNISGSIQAEELPQQLALLPRWTIHPHDVIPSVDVINSVPTLNEFTSVLRQLLSELEANHKNLRRLHILAAIPVSAAVTLGRVHDANVHPDLVIYDRTAGQYTAALRIS